MTVYLLSYMKRKISSTGDTDGLLNQSQGSFAEITQVVTEVQVTKATYYMGKPIEIYQANTLNREKAVQTLRAIAHCLMTGTLGLLVAVSMSIDWQQISNDDSLTEVVQSAKTL